MAALRNQPPGAERDRSRPPLARGAAVLTVVIAVGVAGVTALLVVPWDWVPGGELTPTGVEDVFSAPEVSRAEAFAERRRWISWSSYAVSLLVSLAWALTPPAGRLLRALGGRLPWGLAVVTGSAVVLLTGRMATLPFSLALREQSLAYGLTNQDLGSWSLDAVTSWVVSWSVTTLLLLLAVASARRWARWWFLTAGALASLLVIVGSFLYPVLVEPLFNDFDPMPDGSFRESVLALAEREGVEVSDVLVADASRRTTTLNAYVSGFGHTRRLVVYDTLLESLPPDQARAVIAHEIAHARHGDVVVGTLLGALGSVAAVALLALLLEDRRLQRWSGTRGAADPAALALVLALASVGSLLASPVVNTVSRAVEVRADRDSLAATRDDDAFVAVQRQLALRSVQDPTPPRWSQIWFGSHPTVLQRAGLPQSMNAAAEDEQ